MIRTFPTLRATQSVMTERTNKIIIRHGIEHSTVAGSITGGNASREEDGTPTVLLVVRSHGGDTLNHDLRPSETFVVGDEKWEVADIRRVDTPDWYAVLTRVR